MNRSTQCLNEFRVVFDRLRAESSDHCRDLIDWMMTLDGRKFNGVGILELDDATRLVCLTRDFCSVTKFEWTTADLMMLPTMITLAGLNPFDRLNGEITYCEFALNLITTLDRMQSIAIEPPVKPSVVPDFVKPDPSFERAQAMFLDCRIDDVIPLLERSTSPRAKYLLGLIFFEAINVVKDVERAKKYLMVGAQQNFPLSMRLCAAVGLMPWSNVRLYIDELKRLATSGDIFAQYELGQCYFNRHNIDSNSPADIKTALKHYEAAATRGYYLAHWRAAGIYVAQDHANYDKALEHSEAAAKVGHGASENRLAMLYWNGTGVTKNRETAIKYYRRAAEHKYFTHLLRLAQYYRDEIKNPSEYFRWLRFGEKYNAPNVLSEIALAFLNGWGVAKNGNKALEYFKRAAEAGDARAKIWLKNNQN